MNIERVIDVVISRANAAVDRQGFGRAMILGTHTKFGEDVKLYTSMPAVALDFATSDPEYKAAAAHFGQQLKPVDLLIGKRTAPVEQVSTFTVGALADGNYTVTLNGTAFTYNTEGSGAPASKTEVADALMDLINAGSEPVTATLGGSAPDQTLVLTAAVAGDGFTAVATTANLTVAATTPNHGVADDLLTIWQSGALGKSWWALVLTSRTDADILQAAAWVTSYKRFLLACTNDAGVVASSTSDIAAQLEALSYDRALLQYSEDADAYPEAAWLGRILPLDAGSAAWAHKSLTGIVADDLTDTQIVNIESKNANHYTETAGIGDTFPGKVASGEWADVIHGLDWLESGMQEDVFTLLATVPKVPFMDAGIDLIANVVAKRLDMAVRNHIITDDWVINRPAASSFTSEERSTRELTRLTFTANLQGAIIKTTINGTVAA